MKKLIIFDLDGTILDTLKDLTNSVNYLLIYLNKPLKTQSQIKNLLGSGPRFLLEQAIGEKLDEKRLNELFDIYNEHYNAHKQVFTKPYEGIKEVIKKLKNAGYLLAVCSNKQHQATTELVNSLFKDDFDLVLGTSNQFPRKPSSQMVDYIIKSLNVDLENVVYVGDTEVDMQTAINANVKMIAVLYGFRSKAVLKKYNPFSYADKPIEIIDIIKDIFTDDKLL